MMAEKYEQLADGSANPTGAAQPQDAPLVTRADDGMVGKVVEAPKSEKPKGSTTASTKVTTAKKTAAKKKS